MILKNLPSYRVSYFSSERRNRRSNVRFNLEGPTDKLFLYARVGSGLLFVLRVFLLRVRIQNFFLVCHDEGIVSAMFDEEVDVSHDLAHGHGAAFKVIKDQYGAVSVLHELSEVHFGRVAPTVASPSSPGQRSTRTAAFRADPASRPAKTPAFDPRIGCTWRNISSSIA